MSNIPGVVVPGVYTDVQTLTSGVSVPGGTRLACIMGEGSRSEVLVSAAVGNGDDGFNPQYSSVSGSDGRHFKLSLFPVVSNRTTLFRNGVPLIGLEEAPASGSFDNNYDYRIDVATGRIELQTAYLVDQGGSFWTAASTNYGSGTINNLTIVDPNAPSETWTIKCVAVQRDGYGVPMTETARFLSFGSVSGSPLDGYGNPVVWMSGDDVVSNGTLSFSIAQNPLQGSNNLKEGDTFTVKTRSGVLLRNDSLSASYIAVTDINAPVFRTGMQDIASNHGAPSLDNNLSLGAAIAFANAPPGVICLQTKPAMARRSSFDLSSNVRSNSSDKEDFVFPLPVGVSPNTNSSVHFFVTNPTTGVEQQVIPNKFPFFTVTDTSTTPTLTDFVTSNSTYSYSYTMMNRSAVTKTGSNGVVDANLGIPGTATLASPSFTFTASDAGKQVKLINATNVTNVGTFPIVSASNGQLNIKFNNFVAETNVSFTVRNATTGAQVAAFANGVIAPDGTDGTKCTLTSSTANFTTMGSLNALVVTITSATNVANVGQFLISAGSGQTQAVLKKYFVDESPVRFEVIDSTKTGAFVVINKAVVPAGFGLRVTLIDNRDADFYDLGWLDALAALEAIDVDMIVPLPKQTISAIFQNALAHCRTMSNIKNKRERMLFCGAIKGLLPDYVLGNKPAAVEDIGILEGIQGDSVSEILAGNTEDLLNYSVVDAFGTTYRCVYFYPDEVLVTTSGGNLSLDGFYIACAAAGYFSGVTNVAMPLTNKVLAGVTIPDSKRFSPTVLAQLVSAGITVLQPVAGGGTVIQGKTTTQSGFPEEEEISIIFIRDRIAKTMRTGFAGYIGLPEDVTLAASLTSRANGLLTSFVTGGLITAYTSLTIVRDKVDPRQWNISVLVQPVYSVNWIYIKVSVGTI